MKRYLDKTRVGVTRGLASLSCNSEFGRVEQAYVSLVPSETHPIEIEGMVGFSSVGLLLLTKAQGTELIGLLAAAVAALP